MSAFSLPPNHSYPLSRYSHRMKRNTDSMLEDAVIASALKKRLAVRWEQVTKKSLTSSGLADFIMQVSSCNTVVICIAAVARVRLRGSTNQTEMPARGDRHLSGHLGNSLDPFSHSTPLPKNRKYRRESSMLSLPRNQLTQSSTMLRTWRLKPLWKDTFPTWTMKI